jgi:hypothetical protein
MAKKSMVEREVKRQNLVQVYASKRAALKAIVSNKELPMEERFAAQLKLSALPRNSAKTRLHNRCQLTGRPLVRRAENVNERSSGRYAHTNSKCADAWKVNG